MNKYINNLYNTDDDLGVKMFGASTWNRLKARAAAATDSMLEHPAAPRIINNDRRHDELFTKLFRPDIKSGNELLGGGWSERVADCTMGDVFDSAKNLLSSNAVKTGADIFHNAANIFSYVPGYGKYVEAGRKGTNFLADALRMFGFGTDADQTVKKAAIGGGTLLLIGGGVAIWYFGFHKNKKKGRK